MDIYAAIRGNINSSGQHLMSVFPRAGNPGHGFIYTIGMIADGLPELLCIGNYPPHLIGTMLNIMADRQREEGKPFEEGLLDIGWAFPVKIRKASDIAKSEYTVQAGRYYDTEDYSVLQAMICDPQGKFPGEEGIEPRFDVPQP